MTLSKIELMINYAHCFINVPYKWGGDNPLTGLDCGGFCQEMLISFGYIPFIDRKIDRNAQALYYYLQTRNWVEKKDRGAILFFGRSKEQITHTSLCILDDLMIESGGGDHTTTTLQRAIEQNARIRIRPIRSDLVGYKFPPGE